MDNRQYKNAFQNIHFSENLEEQILDEIHHASARNGKTRRRLIYTGVAATLCMLVLCIMVPTVSSYQILSRKSRSAVHGILKFSVLKSSDLENLEVKKSEMLLIDSTQQFEQNQPVSFEGNVEGDSLNYEIGYIYNDQYTKLDSFYDASSFEESFCTSGAGSYYLCISNHSTESFIFTGNVNVNTNDLTYQADAIYLSENSTITIQTDTIQEHCITYYIENCQTKKISKIPVTTKKAVITTNGSYRIFGVTSNHAIIDLKNCISVENSVTQSECDSFIPLKY